VAQETHVAKTATVEQAQSQRPAELGHPDEEKKKNIPETDVWADGAPRSAHTSGTHAEE
jgi:hypothetical protein